MIQLQEEKFASFIEERLHEILSSSDVSSFPQLLRLLPGVPPPDTIASLNRLDASFPSCALLIKDAQRSPSGSIRQSKPSGSLGVPHPLDYDWRFNRETVEFLLRRSIELSDAARSLIMIGTPTAAIAALRYTQLNTVLLDANSWAVHQLSSISPKIKAMCVDVRRDALPTLSAPVIVADPPWYAESISSFLWAASQLCETGGYVMASFPGIGTRPGIVEERESLIAFAAENGLKHLESKTGAVTYETPPFERSAFRACGIRNLPADWRRGDLLLFRRTMGPARSRPVNAKAGDEWVDVEIGGIRLKVRAPLGFGFDDPRLHSIIPGDVLPSVSRRDPRRGHADIWSPTNRIFSCQGRAVLVRIAHAMASGEQPAWTVGKWLGRNLPDAEQAIVQEASKQLCALVRHEMAELADLQLVGRRVV
jgi:hypothetical protein